MKTRLWDGFLLFIHPCFQGRLRFGSGTSCFSIAHGLEPKDKTGQDYLSANCSNSHYVGKEKGGSKDGRRQGYANLHDNPNPLLHLFSEVLGVCPGLCLAIDPKGTEYLLLTLL